MSHGQTFLQRGGTAIMQHLHCGLVRGVVTMAHMCFMVILWGYSMGVVPISVVTPYCHDPQVQFHFQLCQRESAMRVRRVIVKACMLFAALLKGILSWGHALLLRWPRLRLAAKPGSPPLPRNPKSSQASTIASQPYRAIASSRARHSVGFLLSM